MNDTSNPNTSQQGHCVFEPLCSAVNEGAEQARAAAEKAIPKVKAAISGATYWLGYGVSFASVFSYTLVKELAPEALKAGCREGARSGQKTAEDLAGKARHDAPATTPSPATELSGPAA